MTYDPVTYASMTEKPVVVRGFTPFRAGRRGGRAFARSWWGRVWIEAVEDSALDLQALKSGRKYAFTGRVGSITVSRGRLTAPVHAEGGDTYRTALALQPLTERQWELFLDQVAARAGHIAALLDRDMPHDLAAAAEDVGVPLLPGMGGLDPSCDCEEWGHPCRHAAALAYQAAWLLDEDPFLLLLMRGLGEKELLDALQNRGAVPERPRENHPDGRNLCPVSAADAYTATPGMVPDPPEPPTVPGDMPVVPTGPGVDPAILRLLARDAAERALDLLTGRLDTGLRTGLNTGLNTGSGTGLDARFEAGLDADAVVPDIAEPALDLSGLDIRADGVRLAALHAGPPEVHARLRAGHDRPADFERAVAAWRFGGALGLHVHDHTWAPGRAELARVNAELAFLAEDAWAAAPEFRVWRNRWTHTERGVQLRYGPDGRWYPYREHSGAWWPAGYPDRDPMAALDVV